MDEPLLQNVQDYFYRADHGIINKQMKEKPDYLEWIAITFFLFIIITILCYGIV